MLWLWRRLAVAALIELLAWELPCALGVALKKTKKKNFFFFELTTKLKEFFSEYLYTHHQDSTIDFSLIVLGLHLPVFGGS